MTHNHDLPASAQAEIKERTVGILDDVRHLVRTEDVRTFDDIREAIDDDPYDDTAAIDVSIEDRLTLIELHADDLGLVRIDVAVDQLSVEIEATAAQVVCQLATDRAKELIDGLEKLFDEFSFDASDLRAENEYAMFAHARESEPADDCVVYQYRNLESGEIHVNVWEYTFPGTDFKIYINEYGDAEEMTHLERTTHLT